MLKKLWIVLTGFRRPSCRALGWRQDPLSHPVLAGMSANELADLPFDPTARPET